MGGDGVGGVAACFGIDAQVVSTGSGDHFAFMESLSLGVVAVSARMQVDVVIAPFGFQRGRIKADRFGEAEPVGGCGADLHAIVIGACVDRGVEDAEGGDGVGGVAVGVGADAQAVLPIAQDDAAVQGAIGGIEGTGLGGRPEMHRVVA